MTDDRIAPDENWINKKWRPAMGWMYMTVCIFDFILFPILYTIAQMMIMGKPPKLEEWNPLTLMGGGLFHVAMGAVLGITAWSRGKEKIVGYENQQPQMRPTRYNEYNEYENDYGREDPADHRDRLTRNSFRETRS